MNQSASLPPVRCDWDASADAASAKV